jgi:hypothetical protein
LSWGFRIDIQVKTVFAIRSLIAIAPLRSIKTGIMNGLITRMAETITQLHPFPSYDRLWFLPAKVPERRSGIGDALVDIHTGIIGQHSLNLTTFDGQHGIVYFGRSASHQRQ